MSWRSVVITQRCKLDLKMGYMVVRSDEVKKIRLDEISVIVIENNAVSITGCLLEALSDKKIKVIFCDSKRNYRKFRKFLVKNGFVMMQESVYCRMVLNQSIAGSMIQAVKKNKPPHGIVQLLTVTEKQFAKMEFITGERKSDVLDTDERLVIL